MTNPISSPIVRMLDFQYISFDHSCRRKRIIAVAQRTFKVFGGTKEPAVHVF